LHISHSFPLSLSLSLSHFPSFVSPTENTHTDTYKVRKCASTNNQKHYPLPLPVFIGRTEHQQHSKTDKISSFLQKKKRKHCLLFLSFAPGIFVHTHTLSLFLSLKKPTVLFFFGSLNLFEGTCFVGAKYHHQKMTLNQRNNYPPPRPLSLFPVP
jgi:hypothetical protein